MIGSVQEIAQNNLTKKLVTPEGYNSNPIANKSAINFNQFYDKSMLSLGSIDPGTSQESLDEKHKG